MREQSIKYLRTASNELYCFFCQEHTIYYKKYEQNHWGEPCELAQNTVSNFTLCSNENQIFLLYHVNNGTIHISRTKNGRNWDDKTVFENQTAEGIESKFFMHADKNRLHLIYNILISKKDSIHSLMYTVLENGTWSKPSKIDTIVPFQKTPYFYSILNEHHIIFYYRKNETTVVSREILLEPYTIGTCNTILQLTLPCLDLCFLADENTIHILAILRGFFTCQLVYKNKRDAKLSSPRVLWEGPVSEGCTLFKLNSQLWFLWTYNGLPYYCTSDDNGISISNIHAYKEWFPKNPMKVEYYETKNKKDLILTELFTETDFKDSRVAILPDLKNDFYPIFSKTTIHAATTEDKSPEDNLSAAMQNKMQQYELFCAEKNAQIAELNANLSARSEELSQLNAQWIGRIRKMKEEKKKLSEKLAFYEGENERLKKTIQYLENKTKYF